MKRIFLGALAATLFFSCSKESDDVNNPGEKALVNISVTSPETKATGTVATDAVGNFTVFITNSSGEIEWSAYSSGGTDLTGANAVSVSNTAQHVYVVANAGNLTSSITTMASLNAFLADLNGTGSQSAVRWATGSTVTALSFAQNAGGDYEASTSVTLTFIAARITLKIVDNMSPTYNAAATDGSLVLERVAVLNARGESKLFGSSLIPTAYTAGKKFYTGLNNPASPDNFTYFPASVDYTFAQSLLSDAIPAGNFTNTYYYYVFENNATTAAAFPTIITLVGEFDGEKVYFPVHLANYEQFTGGGAAPAAGPFITRGYSYDITVTLTVDPSIGGGGPFIEDPTVTGGKVNVSIDLAPWIPVVLGKQF